MSVFLVNLLDTHKSRWGDELTAEKMQECVLAAPGGRCPNRILGVDRGRSAEAFEIRRATRGQESARSG